MLKKLLLPAFVLAFLVPASAQHLRRVLIEEFTNASCGPCAAQNPTFNATIDANYDYLTPIKYQTVWPGVDPMNAQNPTEVATRVTYYGVTGVPNGRQNGILEVFPMTSYSAATIQDAYNTMTPVTITLTHEITADLDSVILHVAVTSDAALSGTLRLRTAITEKAINFDAAPGTNGETEFFNVMRKMLPNAAGTITGDFAAGETKTYDFAWPLAYIYDLNRINAVAWLQDDATTEVWQSAITEPIGGIPAVGIKIPTVNTLNCTSGAHPSFTLINTAPTTLTSATLAYRMGSDAFKNLDWTGTLAPGASTEVELPDYSLTTSGTGKLQVQILGSNNGIQTNMVNFTSTVTIKSLFVAPTALPISLDFQGAIFPPTGWTAFNPGSVGWKLASVAGFGSTRSTRCNFYNIPPATNAELITPKIDMTQANGTSTLSFDHAYAYYSSTLFDSLLIQVSTDCGDSWTTVFHDGQDGLATAAPYSAGEYVPADDSEWAPIEIDLTPFNGKEVFVRFTGESGYGNDLYIDNLKISTVTGVQELPLTAFSLQPNPTRTSAQVRFSLVNPESVRLMVFNAIGSLVQSRDLGNLVSGDHVIDLDASQLNSGTYRVVLQGNDGLSTTEWVILK